MNSRNARRPRTQRFAPILLTLVAAALIGTWGCKDDTQSSEVDMGTEHDSELDDGSASTTERSIDGGKVPSSDVSVDPAAPLASVAASDSPPDMASAAPPLMSSEDPGPVSPSSASPSSSADPSSDDSTGPPPVDPPSSSLDAGGSPPAPDASGGSMTPPGVDVIQPPTQPITCEIDNSEVNTPLGEACTVRATCDGNRQASASCYENGANLDCGCWIDDGTVRRFEINALEADTCERTLQMCAERTPVVLDGEFACEAPVDQTIGTGCTRLSQCSREATLPNGLVVSEVIAAGVECSGNDVVDCFCTDLDGKRSGISFADVTSPEACTLAYSVCLEGATPIPQGDSVCTTQPNEAWANENRCAQQRECERPVTLGDRAVTLSEFTQASCAGLGNEWNCNCWDWTRAVNYSQAFEQDGPNTCEAAFEQCQTALTTEVTGATRCGPVEDRRGPQGCLLEHVCSRFGEGELPVERQTSASVICHVDEANIDQWLCQCITRGVTSHSTWVMPTPEQNACDLLMPACQTLVDVVKATGEYAEFPALGAE